MGFNWTRSLKIFQILFFYPGNYSYLYVNQLTQTHNDNHKPSNQNGISKCSGM